MRLPNVERAVIDPAKVRDCALSPDHRDGRSKARFFGALGFTRDAWPQLQAALLAVARDGEAAPAEASVFGQQYVVHGIVQGPAGHAAAVVAVVALRIVVRGDDVPRPVTAYPEEAPR